jgi:hypothetical protein
MNLGIEAIQLGSTSGQTGRNAAFSQSSRLIGHRSRSHDSPIQETLAHRTNWQRPVFGCIKRGQWVAEPTPPSFHGWRTSSNRA